MKRSILLLLAALAFLTVTAFNFLVGKKSITKPENNTSIRPRIAFGCSPTYIPQPDESIPALKGWGNYRWKISTTSDSAQFYFNQGINMYYAFHIIEARASFDKATRFDPNAAMAWWGKALAFGPNINDFGYQRPSQAYPSAVKANELKASASAAEKALIEAMNIRYSSDSAADQSQLNEKYKTAMTEVYKKHKMNADVVALYADALLLIHPWDLYDHDLKPKEWTPQIVSVLKEGLKLSPSHPGLNHYYIHAVEASAHPEDALRSADLLSVAMPQVAHVTHMPSHIYIRTGQYNKGIGLNEKAVAGYQNYLKAFPAVAENLPLYSLHNLHMKMACAHMAGNYRQSITSAIELQKQIPEFYLTIPGPLGHYIQYLHQSPLMTYIRFGKWNEILKEKMNDSLEYTPLLQHFSRGLAFTRLKKLPEALNELQQLKTKMESKPSLKDPLAPFNSAYAASSIARLILEGEIASAQNDHLKAISLLREAVRSEDLLIYNEPRDWLLPSRHYLAAELNRNGQYTDAIKILQQDLKINPSNGWALTAIIESYKKTKKSTEATTAGKRLMQAWKGKDVVISKVVF